MKRLLLAGCGLLVLAVVFHAALLRWVIAFGGPKGAEMAGIALTWDVEGSVLKDLRLRNVVASGSMVEKATVGELALDYDAWHMVKTGDVDVIRRVVLKEVDAVIDLRKLSPATAKSDEPKSAPSGKPPPLVWPKVIDIEDVNAEVILADGAKVIVRGLTLRVGAGMPGVFRVDEFSMGDMQVAKVQADVTWGERELSISGLALPYGAELKSLALSLTQFGQDQVAVNLDVRLGKATVALEASASGIFGGAMDVTADAKVRDLASSELKAFKLPEDVVFGPVSVDLHAVGDPTRPMAMSVDGSLRVPDVRAAGAMLDAITAMFEIKDGVARVSEAKVVRGANEVVVEVESKLAEDVTKSAWTANVRAKIAEVKQLLAEPPPVRGLVELTANAQGIGATPTKATAHVDGSDLGFEQYTLPKLAVDVSLDGKEARVSLPALMLGEGNQIDVNASMTMDDAMPVKADWKVQVDDPAALLKTVGLPPLEQPITAKVATSGTAAFEVNEVMQVAAEVDLSVKDGRYGDAPLPLIEVRAKTAKGEAMIEACRVIVDERNHIDLTGKGMLASPMSFDAKGNVELPELKSLNALLAVFKAPTIESGSVLAKFEAAGDAAPFELKPGLLTMQAAKVKVAGMPEAADVDLKTTFEGTTAKIEMLQAVLGPWKLLTEGVVTDKEANLSELSFWQKERQLMSGHARAPFDVMKTGVANGQPLDVILNAKDLPIHEIAAAAGAKDVPPGMLSADLRIGGRLDSADVEVKLGVKDFKAPGLPSSFQAAQVDVLTTLKANRLVLDAKLNQAPLQPVLLKAEVPVVLADLMKNPDLAMDLPIQATLDMAESDLSFVREFAPEVVQAIPAKMKLNAKVGGTVKAPLIDSALDLDVPTVSFVSADLPSVRDVRVRVRTHDRLATIEDISLLLAGGRVKLDGTIDAAKTDDPRFNLKLEAREALVFRNPTSSLRANADITCVGGMKAAHVSGVVEAVRGRIFQEVNLLPNVMSVVKQSEPLPPPPPSTSKVDQKVELPPMLKDWTFDLKVRTRDPVLLAGNLVNGAISADIALGGTGAGPRLTGFANVDRLLLKLPFSLMKITKGVVTMNPENPFAPKLDVRGESRIGSNDITLYVYGDAMNPKTRFTSSPPMSEADIVTLIGTGMTLGGDNAQMASEAMSRAAMLVVMETYRKIFNKKKTVSDRPPKLHMSMNPGGADRANDSMQAMYELTPSVRFTGRFTQSGRMKALLGYVLKFGKAARAMEESSNEE